MSTTFPNFEISSESSRSTINMNFKLRNIVLGIVGMLANIAAFAIVMKSTKVREGRKLLLLNLIASDVGCVLGLIIYGVDESTQISEGKGCIPMIFTIIFSIQNSYVMCLLLSIMNFLAVFKPFQFTRLVSWKNTGIAVIIGWITMAGSVYWWVVTSIPSGLTCAPIVVMRDPGLVGLSSVMSVTSLGVFGLNGAVVNKLKSRSRNLVGLTERPLEQNTDESKEEKSTFSRFVGVFLRGKKNKIKPTDRAEINQKTLPTASSIWMGDNVSEASVAPNQQAEVCNSGLVPSMSQSQIVSPSTSQSNPRQKGSKFSNTTLATPMQQEGRRENGNRMAQFVSTNTFTSGERICRELVILTSFSCMITLPIAIYLILIVVGVIEDPEQMVGTPVGIFVSSCPTSKAVINPFFYVLNFVNWRKMFTTFLRRDRQII